MPCVQCHVCMSVTLMPVWVGVLLMPGNEFYNAVEKEPEYVVHTHASSKGAARSVEVTCVCTRSLSQIRTGRRGGHGWRHSIR